MTESLYPPGSVLHWHTGNPEPILTAEQWKAIVDNNPSK